AAAAPGGPGARARPVHARAGPARRAGAGRHRIRLERGRFLGVARRRLRAARPAGGDARHHPGGHPDDRRDGSLARLVSPEPAAHERGLARMPELTVVVPAYRERENIAPLLEALGRALEGRDWEAIVVVDDAGDGSEQLVRERA